MLRKKIGYRGLVVSDDLEMGGVLKAASIGQAAVSHIRAGGDLCLVCHVAEHVEQAYEALLAKPSVIANLPGACQESLARVQRIQEEIEES